MDQSDINNIKYRYKNDRKLYEETIKLINIFNKFYKTIDPAELDVLKNYKTTGFWYVNGILRKDFREKSRFTLYQPPTKDSKCKGMVVTLENLRTYLQGFLQECVQKIIVLDNLFRNTLLTKKSITVFRGVSEMHNQLSKLRKKDKIIFDNFLSTSLSINIADQFAGIPPYRDILVINIPKGIPYMYLPWEMETPMNTELLNDEFEIFFPRGAVLKLIKTESFEDYAVFRKKYKNINITKHSPVITFYHFSLIEIIDASLQSLPNVDEIIDNIRSVEVYI